MRGGSLRSVQFWPLSVLEANVQNNCCNVHLQYSTNRLSTNESFFNFLTQACGQPLPAAAQAWQVTDLSSELNSIVWNVKKNSFFFRHVIHVTMLVGGVFVTSLRRHFNRNDF